MKSVFISFCLILGILCFSSTVFAQAPATKKVLTHQADSSTQLSPGSRIASPPPGPGPSANPPAIGALSKNPVYSHHQTTGLNPVFSSHSRKETKRPGSSKSK